MPRHIKPAALLLLLLPAACMIPRHSSTVSKDLPRLYILPAFERLSFSNPVFICHDGANPEYLYVVERAGRVLRFENSEFAEEAEVFLDIRHQVLSGDNGGDREEGLLGLAFHPKFANNGVFFAAFTAGTTKARRNIIARFALGKDGLVADEGTEHEVLSFAKPYGNHNGCTLLFGPDGYLYAGYGDGGGQGDPFNYGQDLSNLFGTIIRIDVDRKEGGKRYAIPPDNPFAGREGARPEIFAYGLRNPYRMSFDGDNLWLGDVGQYRREMVYLVRKGGNYGWSLREGSTVYKPGTPADPITPPLAEYNHEFWRGCVIGGHVYRGQRFKSLRGLYIYCDHMTGRFYGLEYKEGKTVANGEMLYTLKPGITSFGVDAHDELFACGLDGRIYRIAAYAELALAGGD